MKLLNLFRILPVFLNIFMFVFYFCMLVLISFFLFIALGSFSVFIQFTVLFRTAIKIKNTSNQSRIEPRDSHNDFNPLFAEYIKYFMFGTSGAYGKNV